MNRQQTGRQGQSPHGDPTNWHTGVKHTWPPLTLPTPPAPWAQGHLLLQAEPPGRAQGHTHPGLCPTATPMPHPHALTWPFW